MTHAANTDLEREVLQLKRELHLMKSIIKKELLRFNREFLVHKKECERRFGVLHSRLDSAVGQIDTGHSETKAVPLDYSQENRAGNAFFQDVEALHPRGRRQNRASANMNYRQIIPPSSQ
ncbi:MAG: hypothetical protein ACQEQ4_01980 [Fibrobacterota bacterium]